MSKAPIIESTKKNITICIDIGHNVKNDNGAGDPANGQLSENDAAKAIGNQIIELLNRWGYNAMKSLSQADIDYLNSLPGTTPEQIRFGLNESLRLRCKNANLAQADLFVSIHLNGNPEGLSVEKKGRGSAVYAITNDEIALSNNILKYICNQHYELGPDEFLNAAKRVGLLFSNRGVQDGRSLYVLKNTDARSILIECCFVDHPNDINIYMDKAPYVNHELTKLEEGVDYVNMNILSYNFFGYSIARGIDDFFKSYDEEKQQCIAKIKASEPLNYVCFTDCDATKAKASVMNYGKYEELFYGKRILSVLKSEIDDNNNVFTRVFLTYNNFNLLQSAHGYFSENINTAGKKDAIKELYGKNSIYKNLAALGTEVTIGKDTYYEFKLKNKRLVRKSDGSDYFVLDAGSIVGIKKIVELDGAYGSVVCEPTTPNLIKINYVKRKGAAEKENLYNLFSNEDYAWLETNLNSCMIPENFDLELNI